MGGDAPRVCLDLFSGLGGFSAAFADDPGWRVVTVDVDPDFEPDLRADVMDLRPADLPDADVVLASPPCTQFSTGQKMNGPHEPDPAAIALVYHALGLVKATRPEYWYLENPRGRLRTLVGPPRATVTYCQYGEDHMKPTDLWGEHAPMDYRACAYGDDCHVNHRDGSNAMRDDVGKRTPAERAKVPYDLSAAIRGAVEDALDGPTYQQARLGEATR